MPHKYKLIACLSINKPFAPKRSITLNAYNKDRNIIRHLLFNQAKTKVYQLKDSLKTNRHVK